MHKRLLKYAWKVTNRRASQSNLVNCILIDAHIFSLIRFGSKCLNIRFFQVRLFERICFWTENYPDRTDQYSKIVFCHTKRI